MQFSKRRIQSAPGNSTERIEGERDPERRLTSRNGYRERRWDTRVGTLALSIPRVATAQLSMAALVATGVTATG